MVRRECFFHWDHAPVHTAAVVQEFVAKKSVQLINHPPYSPDLALADLFLFPKIKTDLAGNTMTQDSLQKTWDGVLRTITKDDFSKAFHRWVECCQKCIDIAGDYVEKS